MVSTDASRGAVDLGGTHVVSAVVTPDGTVVETTRRRGKLWPDIPREVFVERLVRTLRGTQDAAAGVDGWGVAAPGPFDYERGVCLFDHEVAKFEALYGLDLRSLLAERLAVAPQCWRFLNDASAFVLGEADAGAAVGQQRVIGVTLGTGLGSGFLAAGEVVERAPGVPADGRLDRVLLDGAPAEEHLSSRGLLRAYGAGHDIDVVDVVTRAREGELRATAVIDRFAEQLARLLAPWVASFGATCVVVGGGISRAWDLLEPRLDDLRSRGPMSVEVHRAGLGDDAHLVGAAAWARHDHGGGS